MLKKISTRYSIMIVAMFTAITLIFIPIYIYTQKSMFIRLETREMTLFTEALAAEAPFGDPAGFSDYLMEHNERSYSVALYQEDHTLLYTTQKSFPDGADSPFHAIGASLLFSDFSTDALPVYQHGKTQEPEHIAQKRLVETTAQNYYLLVCKNLKHVGAAFSYTNRTLIHVLLLYIVICGIVLFFLMRGLTRSIKVLNDAVNMFARKDYSVHIEGKFHNDEIGMLAENFNKMADRLQEYENMRSRFVRNTTHELKTPLAIISSQVEMMHCAADPEKRTFYYNSALSEIQHMSQLITSFLQYSVGENKTLKTQPELVDLSVTITRLCDTISSSITSKNLRFVCDADPHAALTTEIARTQISHIFNNYIMNAVSHTPEGGLIRVSLERNGDNIRLSIYNDGSSIPEAEMEQIWSEFYSTSDASDNNVGLGLFIVKEIAIVNNTVCGVRNHPSGVEFWFDFHYV